MDASALAIGSSLLLAAQCCVAAWLDFRYRKLPNLLCAVVYCTGILAGLFAHGIGWAGFSAVHALVALLIGAGLFAARIIGAGDAKFYAAVAAWMPITDGLILLLNVSLAGLVLVALWFPMRRRIAAMAPDAAMAIEFRKVPYGMAIASGACLTSLSSFGVWSGGV
jgi:prepilin peptidase CpaA